MNKKATKTSKKNNEKKEIKQSSHEKNIEKDAHVLYKSISEYIEHSHQNIVRSVNSEMIKTYWLIGRDIIEREQLGEVKAKYGKELLVRLSLKLQDRYKKGFSVDNLERARKFYLTYQADMALSKSATALRKSKRPDFKPNLAWSHYIQLIRIARSEARAFYEVEASKNNWSVRELNRQIGSLLFDRLAQSKDKNKVLKLAKKGQELLISEDIIKDPFVLNFLDIPESHKTIESKLEQALIDNLQHFLLELGKGVSFVGRQKRISVDEKHFYIDLVFYSIPLKCYLLLDLKTKELTHNDLGQMQFYVNYYDQECLSIGDNPTVGLILCTKKSDAVVKYTLGEKVQQIFASRYQFHLPTEKELEQEIKRGIKRIEARAIDQNGREGE